MAAARRSMDIPNYHGRGATCYDASKAVTVDQRRALEMLAGLGTLKKGKIMDINAILRLQASELTPVACAVEAPRR
jgi:hypothetical protein